MPKRLSLIVLLVLLSAGTGAWPQTPAAAGNIRAQENVATAKSGTNTAAKAADNDFLAALNGEEAKAEKEEEAPLYVTVFGFIVKLGIVIGLAYVSILGLKKLGYGKGVVHNGNGLKVLESSTLGPNRTLHLVQIGTKRLLIGSTPNNINLIHEMSELDDEVIEAEIAHAPQPIAPQPAGFKDQLRTFLGNRTDTRQTEQTVKEMLDMSTDFFRNKVTQVGSLRRKFLDAKDS